MKKLSSGVSDYEKIKKEGYIYVDKTMYIEKLENTANPTKMFLRPRKFGKILFTSMLECYYDKLKKDEFDVLFKDTYIGKNPTPNRNRYCILKFNFSGIDTTTTESTIKGFREECDASIEKFVGKYGIDFKLNPKQTTQGALNSLFTAFEIQKKEDKIYVIIDEYDSFTNELLGFKNEEFRDLLGTIRCWYEILKKGTESVVDRIFITGLMPITLDGMTSGFNIADDLTRDMDFNNMLGFSKEDVKYIMDELEIEEEKQKEIMPIIKENYGGYIFSEDIEKEEYEKYRMYNPNMTLYFLDEYTKYNKIPSSLVDVNIINDYSKIEEYMNLCKGQGKYDILEKIETNEPVEENLVFQFNPEMDFRERELISLLYYLGYITIVGKEFGVIQFKIPNEEIRQIYRKYIQEEQK